MTLRKARGYLIHLYTTSTLFFVVLAVQWILDERYIPALLAMGITVIIDATDGALARRFRIKDTTPRIDGALLDNVVDFVSYVFLPLLFMLHAGLLLEPTTLFVTFVAFSSAYGFSRTSAKLGDEGFFMGFPSYWNVVVFYLYLMGLPAWFNTVLVVALSVMVFAEIRFLYVSRLRRGRIVHVVLGTAWGAACIAALFVEPGTTRMTLLYGSLAYVAFYTVHSLVLTYRHRAGSRSGRGSGVGSVERSETAEGRGPKSRAEDLRRERVGQNS